MPLARASSGPFCGTMPVQHVAWDPATGRCSRERGAPGTDRRSGAARTWARPGPSRAKASATATVSRRSPGSGTSRPPMERCTPGSSRRVSSAAAMGASPGSMSPACVRIPSTPGLATRQRRPHPPFDRAPPHRPGRRCGSASRPWAPSTRDGGATWVAQNRGCGPASCRTHTRRPASACTSWRAIPSRPDVLFQQNHCGVYRSDDAGGTWAEITAGLPSEFGFPMVVHPTRPEHGLCHPAQRRRPGTLSCPMPALRSGGRRTTGRLAAAVVRPAAARCVRGRPPRSDGDRPGLDPASIYFGTSTGQLYGSADDGETWRLIASHLPGISSVETAVIGA